MWIESRRHARLDQRIRAALRKAGLVQQFRNLQVAAHVKIGKFDAGADFANERLLELVESLDQRGEFVIFLCIASRNVTGVTVEPGARIDQE